MDRRRRAVKVLANFWCRMGEENLAKMDSIMVEITLLSER